MKGSILKSIFVRDVNNVQFRQLSEANTELEERNANSSKVVDRMSKNVEQLQWRIRNNFDVPVEGVTPSSMSSWEHQQISTTVEKHQNSSQLT